MELSIDSMKETIDLFRSTNDSTIGEVVWSPGVEEMYHSDLSTDVGRDLVGQNSDQMLPCQRDLFIYLRGAVRRILRYLFSMFCLVIRVPSF